MKNVTYIGPFDEVEIERAPRLWTAVRNGETIEVPDDLAASLLDQTDNWTAAAKAPAPKKENG